MLLIVNVVVNNIRNILTIIFLFSVSQTHAEQIWYENFSIPDKGIWGDEDGITIHSDFLEITNWVLEYDSTLSLSSPEDYAKTVSTKGGRFEVRDIDGEVAWLSEWIDISGYSNVCMQLTTYEIGSGANEKSKYLKAYFRLNGGEKILFSENGENLANWGSLVASQEGLGGDSLQIIVVMGNHYSADKVTLDEIIVSGEVGDNMPPFITDVKVKSSDTLSVFFNETIASTSLEINSFSLSSKTNIYPIISVSEIAENHLCLQIEPAKEYQLFLLAKNISDMSGNISATDTFAFSYFPPVKQNDIIINEIMADPYPPMGLPDCEFIELYNRAAYPVLLEEWNLQVEDKEKEINGSGLLPDSFVIIASPSSCELLSEYGETLPVSGFPSLRNSGTTIRISSEKGMLINEVTYSEKWPLDPDKNNGGWSMEKVDPDRFCGAGYNWEFSINEKGGTPGNTNSVKRYNPDDLLPEISKTEAISPSCLEIYFSESMDTIPLKIANNYTVSPELQIPDSIKILSESKVIIYFSDDFQEDKPYELILSNLSDQCGNLLESATQTFSWSVARKHDLVINEVLSNPYPEGADFVELFNPSEKYLHLDHLLLSNGKDTIQLNSVSENERIVAPGDYLVCTKDSGKASLHYFSAQKGNIVSIKKMPTIYNDEGAVILLNAEYEVIDQFIYYEDLHSEILADITGISLERVDPLSQTNDPANWHSAAECAGYATPGYKNSQYGNQSSVSVSFEPEAFSPNLDGYNDEFHINYHFNKPGQIANCRIFDSSGRFMFQLAKNELLATEGTITWNGEDNTGAKLPLGIYIVLFETFDMNGGIQRYKDAVVLTDVLN